MELECARMDVIKYIAVAAAGNVYIDHFYLCGKCRGTFPARDDATIS